MCAKWTNNVTVTIHLLPVNPAQPGVFRDWLRNTQSIHGFMSEETRNQRLERFPNTKFSWPFVFLVGDAKVNVFLLLPIEWLENSTEPRTAIHSKHDTCHSLGNHFVQDDAARKPIYSTSDAGLAHK